MAIDIGDNSTCVSHENIDIHLLITPNETNTKKNPTSNIYQGMPYILIFSIITAMTNKTKFFLLSFLKVGMITHTHTVTSIFMAAQHLFSFSFFFFFQAE